MISSIDKNPKQAHATPLVGCGDLITPREREVLTWITAGKSNPETAIIMGISQWTVKIHVANLYKKLGVSGRGQVVAKAISLRLISV